MSNTELLKRVNLELRQVATVLGCAGDLVATHAQRLSMFEHAVEAACHKVNALIRETSEARTVAYDQQFLSTLWHRAQRDYLNKTETLRRILAEVTARQPYSVTVHKDGRHSEVSVRWHPLDLLQATVMQETLDAIRKQCFATFDSLARRISPEALQGIGATNSTAANTTGRIGGSTRPSGTERPSAVELSNLSQNGAQVSRNLFRPGSMQGPK